MTKSTFKRFFCVILCAAALLLTLCPVLPAKALSDDPMVMVSSEGGMYGLSTQYRYNANGQLIEKREDESVTEYQYHSNGKIKKEQLFMQDKLYSIREYDNKGNITAISYASSSGMMIQTEKYTNKYDSQNRLISFKMQQGSDFGEEAVFTYHSDGSFTVEWESYHIYEGQKLPYMHRIGRFIEDGRQIYQLVDLEYGQRVNYTWSLTLDLRGNPMIFTELVDMDSSYIIRLKKYINEYDDYERLVHVNTYANEYDSGETAAIENEPLTLVNEIVNMYDNRGRLIRSTESQYDQKSYWGYDVYGNLVECGAELSSFSELDEFLMRNDGVYPVYCEAIYDYLPLSEALKLD